MMINIETLEVKTIYGDKRDIQIYKYSDNSIIVVQTHKDIILFSGIDGSIIKTITDVYAYSANIIDDVVYVLTGGNEKLITLSYLDKDYKLVEISHIINPHHSAFLPSNSMYTIISKDLVYYYGGFMWNIPKSKMQPFLYAGGFSTTDLLSSTSKRGEYKYFKYIDGEFRDMNQVLKFNSHFILDRGEDMIPVIKRVVNSIDRVNSNIRGVIQKFLIWIK